MVHQKNTYIYEQIVSFMDEGIALLSMNGRFQLANHAFLRILGIGENIEDHSFAATFLEDARNNDFVQCVVDCIYSKSALQGHLVTYYAGNTIKTVVLTTSFLSHQGEKLGVILVVGDLTELHELKDAVKAMDAIQRMNTQLESRNRLISQTFGRYLSDEIVATLLDTPEGATLGGKREYITILMSDIRGFTATSERMPPVDLMRMLNHYLSQMTTIVQKNKGTIIEFIGDAIFAVFGAPIQQEFHECAAVKCAIEMQNCMASVNQFNRQNGFEYMEMGIGINTGEVILGNIGSEKRTKYGVVGQNVNLAGRVESFTVGGQVLISEFTAKAIPNLISKGEQKILPKGIPTEITLYDVSAVGNTVLQQEIGAIVSLDTPLPLDYQILDGKYAQAAMHRLCLLALSNTQALVDITTLPQNTNIKLFYKGQEIFAKAMGQNRLHFTGGAVALLMAQSFLHVP